jgi:hypothetical protein
MSPLHTASLCDVNTQHSMVAFTEKPNTSSPDDMSIDSLLKSLSSIKSSIIASSGSTKALAGALLGLRGSVAHKVLVHDGKLAVEDMKHALKAISKAEQIVREAQNPKGGEGSAEAAPPAEVAKSGLPASLIFPTLN